MRHLEEVCRFCYMAVQFLEKQLLRTEFQTLEFGPAVWRPGR